MAGPSPLCKTLLRKARIAETALTGAGDTFLEGILTTITGYMAGGGLQMVSAATASKSFSFAVGYNVQALTEALDEAMILWDGMTTDQLSALLDRRVFRRACLTFTSS